MLLVPCMRQYHRPSFGSASNLHHPRLVISILTLTKISYIAYTLEYTFKIKFVQFENVYEFFPPLGNRGKFSRVPLFLRLYSPNQTDLKFEQKHFFFIFQIFSKLRFTKRSLYNRKGSFFKYSNLIFIYLFFVHLFYSYFYVLILLSYFHELIIQKQKNIHKVHKVYTNIKIYVRNIKIQKYV